MRSISDFVLLSAEFNHEYSARYRDVTSIPEDSRTGDDYYYFNSIHFLMERLCKEIEGFLDGSLDYAGRPVEVEHHD